MTTVRIAAAGDIHCGNEATCETLAGAVADLDVDVVLLAGDLTTHGEPEQAGYVSRAFREAGVPVFAVLGNHDWHTDQRDALVKALDGIEVIDPGHRVLDVGGVQLGVAGTKGFMGGYPGSHLPDFGEPLLREVYAESLREAGHLEEGLQAIRACQLRVVLMHYAPGTDTIAGEPEPIYAFLGTDRLAPPIIQHEPDLVLHGHAHAGTFEGRVGGTRVLNVSVPVLGRPFCVLELEAPEHAPLH